MISYLCFQPTSNKPELQDNPKPTPLGRNPHHRRTSQPPVLHKASRKRTLLRINPKTTPRQGPTKDFLHRTTHSPRTIHLPRTRVSLPLTTTPLLPHQHLATLLLAPSKIKVHRQGPRRPRVCLLRAPLKVGPGLKDSLRRLRQPLLRGTALQRLTLTMVRCYNFNVRGYAHSKISLAFGLLLGIFPSQRAVRA